MQCECARACVWLCVTSTTRHPPISSMFCYSVIQLGIIPPAQPRRTTLNVNNWIFISPATPYPPCLGKSHPGQTCFTSLFLHKLIRIWQITNIRSLIPHPPCPELLFLYRLHGGQVLELWLVKSHQITDIGRITFAFEMCVTHVEIYIQIMVNIMVA